MLIACWSPKGGSGTTVVACGLALVLARGSQRQASGAACGVWLADLGGGDAPAVVGVAEPPGPGLADWLDAGPQVPADALARLAVDVVPGLGLLPWRGHGTFNATSVGERPAGSLASHAARGEALAAALTVEPRPVVADCGTASGAGRAVAAAATVSLMVLRPCYLALRRALASPIRPSGVVLVAEPGRALHRRDVEDVLGVPVRAQIDYEPAVARAVDAGLLARRPPRGFERALESAA